MIAPNPPATYSRWTHRHPVMEVRTELTGSGPKLPRVRTMWRPDGTDGPWLPVNTHDLARYYVEIVRESAMAAADEPTLDFPA